MPPLNVNAHMFLQGHRVRFADGPVMTVMDFTTSGQNEYIICGWWQGLELRTGTFPPSVLIHTDTKCTESSPTWGAVEFAEVDEFHEFHSG